MDFMSINSVGSYLKTMNMQQKWQSKKARGDYSADGSRSIGEWVEQQSQKAKDTVNGITGGNNNEDKKLTGIRYKLANGKKLTPAEKQYLQMKDPQSYQKLREIEAEQQQFESELRRCRTKDQVQKLKLARVSAALSTVNAVSSNPNIPEGKKLELIGGEQQKLAAIERTVSEFVKSGRYSQLPTEAEKHEAEKLLKEAEEARIRPDSKEEVSSEVKNIKYEAEKKLRSKARGEKEKEENPAVREAKAQRAERLVREAETVRPDAELKKASSVEKTVKKAKAESSYAVRKVRRAKVVSASHKAASAVPADMTVSLDTKA